MQIATIFIQYNKLVYGFLEFLCDMSPHQISRKNGKIDMTPLYKNTSWCRIGSEIVEEHHGEHRTILFHLKIEGFFFEKLIINNYSIQ